MRLDSFLKAGRFAKRRAVARELCEGGKVFVNGREAKPSKEVRPGDGITLKFSSRIIELQVVGLPAPLARNTPQEDLYRITSDMRLVNEKD